LFGLRDEKKNKKKKENKYIYICIYIKIYLSQITYLIWNINSNNYAIKFSEFFFVLEEYNITNQIYILDQTKSTINYVFIFGGHAITYRLTNQRIIIKSTIKSKFITLKHGW